MRRDYPGGGGEGRKIATSQGVAPGSRGTLRSTLASNLVSPEASATFTSATGWVPAGNWTIDTTGDGKAVVTAGSSGNLYWSLSGYVAGRTYRVEVTMVDYVAGDNKVAFYTGGTPSGIETAVHSGNGVHTFDVVMPAGVDQMFFIGGSTKSYAISDVSLREVVAAEHITIDVRGTPYYLRREPDVVAPRFRWPDYDVGDALPEREMVGTGDVLHQAFGNSARGADGRLYICWRRAAEHAVAGEGDLRMKRMDNEGFTEVDVQTVVASVAGRDMRIPSPVVTPTGRVVLVWTDTPSSGSGTSYFKSKYSDDRGTTWSAETTIATIPYAYARSYGGVKVMPSTDPTRQWEIGFPAYYQTTATPDYMVDFFISRDDGETFSNAEALGEAPISASGVSSHNETAMDGVNASVWFAASRASDAIHLSISEDGRQSWSAWAEIPWTSTDVHVAPSLDVVRDARGRPWVLIGVSDRTNDILEWSAALAYDLINTGVTAFPNPTTGHASENAYPSTIIYPDGNLLVSFTREYTGFDYASVHLGYFSYGDLLAERGPTGLRAGSAAVAVASGAITYTSGFMKIDTEASAATDDLDTINGGDEGDILILASQAGARDITLKHGTGNIQLSGATDYILGNGLMRIMLMRSPAFWVEMFRT